MLRWVVFRGSPGAQGGHEQVADIDREQAAAEREKPAEPEPPAQAEPATTPSGTDPR
jgi:hypothetical protein